MTVGALSSIDHFVVLMLENRSFDSLLGSLQPHSDAFNGLQGNESNPDASGASIGVWSSTDGVPAAAIPDPDPGELFIDIQQQLFGSAGPSGTPAMNGFVANYVAKGGVARDIMHFYRPNQIPALSALAGSYAVCDRWFASAPCQTWPNRFFLHTATAGGYENNSPLHFPYMMPTIFRRLEATAPAGWKIYFHDFPQSLTLAGLWDRIDHFRPFSEFLDDARQGNLPSYAFLEPRYFPDLEWPNDMHPPHNVAYGDQLVATVYQALHASPTWGKTVFAVLFDEHGGNFDHVAPPAAPPPAPARAGQVFAFDRLGVRVPAVIASPWIAPGTVFRSTLPQDFDHTSIIRTLRKRFAIAGSMNARDAGAPDLESLLMLDSPSETGRLAVAAAPPPASDDADALARARAAPLNSMQAALHDASALLAPLFQGVSPADHIQSLASGNGPASPPKPSNAGEALQNIRHFLGEFIP